MVALLVALSLSFAQDLTGGQLEAEPEHVGPFLEEPPPVKDEDEAAEEEDLHEQAEDVTVDVRTLREEIEELTQEVRATSDTGLVGPFLEPLDEDDQPEG